MTSNTGNNNAPRGSRFAVGVDIGGTFTDLVGFDLATSRIVVTKAPSTPRELSGGIMECVRKSDRKSTRLNSSH